MKENSTDSRADLLLDTRWRVRPIYRPNVVRMPASPRIRSVRG
jgi:hypothetical protein